MRTSVNQTGRRKIPKGEITIELLSEKELMYKWNLSDTSYVENFEAILELSAIGNNIRHLVATNTLPISGELKIDISPFLIPRSILGRLKIVQIRDDGLRVIVGESQTLRLENDKFEGQIGKSLLDAVFDPSIECAWVLTYDDSEPVLKISDRFENAFKIYSHPVFQFTVLPEIFRQIAIWMLTEDPDEGENNKVALWWQLLTEYGLSPEERASFAEMNCKTFENVQEINARCQELSDRFAIKHRMLLGLSNYLAESES